MKKINLAIIFMIALSIAASAQNNEIVQKVFSKSFEHILSNMPAQMSMNVKLYYERENAGDSLVETTNSILSLQDETHYSYRFSFLEHIVQDSFMLVSDSIDKIVSLVKLPNTTFNPSKILESQFQEFSKGIGNVLFGKDEKGNIKTLEVFYKEGISLKSSRIEIDPTTGTLEKVTILFAQPQLIEIDEETSEAVIPRVEMTYGYGYNMVFQHNEIGFSTYLTKEPGKNTPKNSLLPKFQNYQFYDYSSISTTQN